MEILQRPVTGEELFNREALIKTLTQGQKNIALIGPRKSGKTSLMWEIKPKLEQKGILSPYIYVLFEDTDSSFLVRFVNVCLLHFLRKKGQDGMVFEDSLDTLNEQITQTLELKPRLAKHLLSLRDALRTPPDIGTLEMALKLPAALVSDEDAKFMVMIDEFQNLGTLSLPVIDVLRRQIMTDTGVNYLVAGSEVGMMRDILESSSAPLFGHFAIHRVGAFSIDQARAREAQVREMFLLSDEYTDTRGGMLEGEEFDLITYKDDKLVLGEVKTGNVTLAEVLTFANKLAQVKQDAVGFLFVLETIYPDALTAASERNIEVWDIARINRFRRSLKLEKLTI